VRLTTYHLHVPNVMEIWEPKPPGTLWATPGLLRDCFTFTFTFPVLVFLPMKEQGMGEACSTYGVDNCLKRSGGGSRRRENTSKA